MVQAIGSVPIALGPIALSEKKGEPLTPTDSKIKTFVFLKFFPLLATVVVVGVATALMLRVHPFCFFGVFFLPLIVLVAFTAKENMWKEGFPVGIKAAPHQSAISAFLQMSLRGRCALSSDNSRFSTILGEASEAYNSFKDKLSLTLCSDINFPSIRKAYNQKKGEVVPAEQELDLCTLFDYASREQHVVSQKSETCHYLALRILPDISLSFKQLVHAFLVREEAAALFEQTRLTYRSLIDATKQGREQAEKELQAAKEKREIDIFNRQIRILSEMIRVKTGEQAAEFTAGLDKLVSKRTFTRVPDQITFSFSRLEKDGLTVNQTPVDEIGLDYRLPKEFVQRGNDLDAQRDVLFTCASFATFEGTTLKTGRYVAYLLDYKNGWWKCDGPIVHRIPEPEAALALKRAYMAHFKKS